MYYKMKMVMSNITYNILLDLWEKKIDIEKIIILR